MAENQTSNNMSPVTKLAYIQTILGNIPYTLTEQNTVGDKLSQAVVILEDVKNDVNMLLTELNKLVKKEGE